MPHSISEVFKDWIKHSWINAEPSIQEEKGDKSILHTPRNKGKEGALEPDFDKRDSKATVCRELLEDDELEYEVDKLEYIDYISRGSSSQNQLTHSRQHSSEPPSKTCQHGDVLSNRQCANATSV